MRALAEYAMRGRRQATLVVLISGFLPQPFNLISFSMVGLTGLRREARDAVLITLWGLIPAITHLVIRGDPAAIVMVVLTALLARTLRQTTSWQPVLVLATVAGVLGQILWTQLDAYQASLRETLEQSVVALTARTGEFPLTADQLFQMIEASYGANICLTALLCLLLARWWQSTAVNPGGFREEFHNLKLSPATAGVFAAALAAGLLGAVPLTGFVNIAGVAPALVGLGVAHGLVGLRRLGGHWLIGVYLSALFFVPLIVALGLIDSVLDTRTRLRAHLAAQAKDRSSDDEDPQN